MLVMARRLLWFFIIACVVAYACLVVIGNALADEVDAVSRTVLARDTLTPGAHHLAGMIMVDKTCTQVSLKARQTDTHSYLLEFTTWDDPAASECVHEEVPRPFRTIVFAPATGVTMTATIDGAPLLLVVLPFDEQR